VGLGALSPQAVLNRGYAICRLTATAQWCARWRRCNQPRIVDYRDGRGYRGRSRVAARFIAPLGSRVPVGAMNRATTPAIPTVLQ